MRWKSICLALCVLAVGFVHTSSAVVPGNDDCQNAKPVGNVTDLPFNTSAATFDGPGHFILNSPNLWYCYTATCDGCATVSLLGSSFDTQVAVYDGCECDPPAHKLIRTNDDFQLQQSQVTFPVSAGSQYLIEVGGTRADAKGAGLISISCNAGSYRPSNDSCTYAEEVSEVKDLPFDTTCATFDGLGHCTTSSPNLWYLYTASATDDVTVNLYALDNDFDTKLAVYEGSTCYPSADALIECNDDYGNTFDSQITFPAIAGEQYLIEVGGLHQDYFGEGLLSITNSSTPPAFSNDECKNAKPIGDVAALPFETDTATFDGPGQCMTSPNIWFCYTPVCSGQATISLCDSAFDTMLAVYEGCDCYPTSSDLIACDDDSCGMQSELTIDVVAGQQYLIEVGGYGSDTGQGVLSVSVSCDAPEKSDLGDAPDSTNNADVAMTAYSSGAVKANFPTVFNDDSGSGPYGPVHVNTPTAAYLGKSISSENEADKGPDEDGVNNISPEVDSPDNDHDDDGVVFPLTLPACEWTTFEYQVNVVDPKVDLWVNVWFDFNRDGDWDDASACEAGPASEWAVQNQYLFGLPVGLNQITTPAFLSWHPKSGPEGIWMRITLSEQPYKGGSNPGETGNGGSGPAGRYATGETEDYYFIPEIGPKKDCPLCEDVNGDGVIDMEDLSDLTALWLEQCL